jgi:hypothetical protein
VNFIKAMWNYYVLGAWYYFFPPKSENDPGDKENGK